jgi:hypothetical protein
MDIKIIKREPKSYFHKLERFYSITYFCVSWKVHMLTHFHEVYEKKKKLNLFSSKKSNNYLKNIFKSSTNFKITQNHYRKLKSL